MKCMIANKKHANIFISIFNNLGKLSDSLIIYFTDEHMYIQGMDNSHCSMFEVKIKSEWFDSYSCEESVTIGVITNILYKVLNTRDENQLMYLNYDKDDDKMGIQFKNLKQESKDFPKEFEIPLIDLDSEMLSIPEIETNMSLQMPVKSFSTIIDQLSIFGDTITINANMNDEDCEGEYWNTTINMSSSGTEGNMTVNLMNDKIKVLDLEKFSYDGSLIKQHYNLKFIQIFSSFSKINKNIKMNITNDMPLEVYFSVDNEKDEEKGFVRFFLAPKIDD